MTDWRIVLENGRGRPIRLNLPCVIGRSPKADLRLADPTVSSRHCRLDIEAGNCLIHDLGSTNGTWINHRRIEKITLQPGDQMTLGQNRFLVKHIEAGARLPPCWLGRLPPGWKRLENLGLRWPEAKVSLVAGKDELEEGESLDRYLERQKRCLEQLAKGILLEDTTPSAWAEVEESRSVQWRYRLADGDEITQIQHYGWRGRRLYIVTQTFLPQTPPTLRDQFSGMVIEPADQSRTKATKGFE